MVFSYCKSAFMSVSVTRTRCTRATLRPRAHTHRNEPKSAQRPLRRPQTPRIASPDSRNSAEKDAHGLVKAFSTLSSLTALTDSDSEKTRVAGIDDGEDYRPAQTVVTPLVSRVRRPLVNSPEALTPTPKMPLDAQPKSAATKTKTPRTSKKALALAEQAERAAYAQSLFDELNRAVFSGGLPVETTLVWSNRLLTTAGRARWHR